jgi:protein-S-isoprenylcysteine O-methyltransferase Ste14
MQKDQMYGALIFIVSLVIAILYAIAFFAPWLALPLWWHEWAVGLPVLVFVVAALVICTWIGWTLTTTPPPVPLEAEATQTAGVPASETEAKRDD